MSRGLYAACQNVLLEGHSGGYRIEPIRPGGVPVCHPFGCRYGCLVEGHSGGFRIEPIRPGGVLVGFHPDEVRPGRVPRPPGIER